MQRLVSIALICAMPAAGAMAQAPQSGGQDSDLILAADVVPQPDAEPATGDGTEAEPAAEAEGAAEEEEEGLRIVDASDIALDDLLWVSRIVAVLADTPNDPAFIEQVRRIEARPADFIERDVVVITDTDRNSGSELRTRLRARGFMLAFIEKDGNIAQRRPSPRSVREINAIIDRFPLRRQEMLEQRPSGR